MELKLSIPLLQPVLFVYSIRPSCQELVLELICSSVWPKTYLPTLYMHTPGTDVYNISVFYNYVWVL